MKKKLVLKTKWKIVLCAIIYAAILGTLFYILYKMDQSFMENCMNNGYSYDYCLKNK
jgi:hypothetical protein